MKYLFSKGSPLSAAQKAKMEGELHDNPAMGHMQKGFHKTDMVSHLATMKKQGRLKRK